jgi:hypothetical protein
VKIYDVDGELVNVDVRESSYPLRAKSKSILQDEVRDKLKEKYPRATILEEFTVPGGRLSVDFFIPSLGLVFEINGRQHDEHVPFFHGDRKTSTAYGKQVSHDRVKKEWADINNFKFYEIRSIEDWEKLHG